MSGPTLDDMDAICEMVAEGKTIRQICAHFGTFPGSLFRLINSDQRFMDQYACARDSASDMFESHIIEAAMTTSPENAAADRVKIDALKWVAARRSPKKYGDKVTNEHTGADGAPLMPTVIKLVTE